VCIGQPRQTGGRPGAQFRALASTDGSSAIMARLLYDGGDNTDPLPWRRSLRRQFADIQPEVCRRSHAIEVGHHRYMIANPYKEGLYESVIITGLEPDVVILQ